MDDYLVEQIHNNLNLRETEDLLEIWQNNNTDEWKEEVFEITKGILFQRLGYVPPQSIQAQVNEVLIRVDTYFEAQEYDKALMDCELAIQMTPALAIAYNYRGMIYDEMGQLEKAIADYQKAVRLDPELEDAWYNLKSVEICIEEEFRQSSTKQHLDRALEFVYNDEPEMAMEECELARQTMPSIAIAFNYLGMILEELEQVESAIDAYLEAVQLNPRFYSARENLGNARVKLEEERHRQLAMEDWNVTQEDMEMVPDFEESQDLEKSEHDDSVPEWLYMDEKAFLLVGWPGHRIRQGRSGYDPLDTDFELAHMEGVIIRMLLAGKFRTHNPIYLLLMTCLGLMICFPYFVGMTLLRSDWNAVMAITIYNPYWIIGIVLLINVYLSLRLKKPEMSDIPLFLRIGWKNIWKRKIIWLFSALSLVEPLGHLIPPQDIDRLMSELIYLLAVPIFLILTFMSSTGVTYIAYCITIGEPTTIQKVIQAIRKYFARFFAVTLIIDLPLALFICPILFYSYNQSSHSFKVPPSLQFAFYLFIIFNALMYFPMTEIILNDSGVRKSIRNAWTIFFNHFGTLALTGIILTGLYRITNITAGMIANLVQSNFDLSALGKFDYFNPYLYITNKGLIGLVNTIISATWGTYITSVYVSAYLKYSGVEINNT